MEWGEELFDCTFDNFFVSAVHFQIDPILIQILHIR